jgi:hypothetical protein
METRSKMLGHSIETASRYGAPGASEIEKAAALLDYLDAAQANKGSTIMVIPCIASFILNRKMMWTRLN